MLRVNQGKRINGRWLAMVFDGPYCRGRSFAERICMPQRKRGA